MSKSTMCPSHRDGCPCQNTTASQSLDEMEFERGIWACSLYGDLDGLKSRMNSGKYTVDQRDSAGYTALHYAARNNNLDICEYLVKNGADINAVTKSGKVQLYIEQLQQSVFFRGNFHSLGRKEIVLFLLDKGANPDLEDCDGKTALHRALDNNHIAIAEILSSRFHKTFKNLADCKGLLPNVP